MVWFLFLKFPQYFPRAHKPIDETEEWWAHPDDWPGTFWHDAEAGHPGSIGGYGPFFLRSWWRVFRPNPRAWLLV
eukprot:COSAG01_NODE_7085_length_3359_cov_22.607055_3_plen_75_part_00